MLPRLETRARFTIASVLLLAIAGGSAAALALALRDGPASEPPRERAQASQKSDPAPAPAPCGRDGFPASEFAGCLRSDFNAQQRSSGSAERLTKIACTDVTAGAKIAQGGPKPGYRYFGCRLVFNQDGPATAVMAWHRASSFAAGVTIERIDWDRKSGIGSQ